MTRRSAIAAPGASFALRVELPPLTDGQRAPVCIGTSPALTGHPGPGTITATITPCG